MAAVEEETRKGLRVNLPAGIPVLTRNILSCMNEQILTHLQKLVDQLGPGLWLELDDAAFRGFFGGALQEGSPAVAAATRFARQNDATFVFDAKLGTAKFGRAYFKQDGN